jgi:hypothetical protein
MSWGREAYTLNGFRKVVKRINNYQLVKLLINKMGSVSPIDNPVDKNLDCHLGFGLSSVVVCLGTHLAMLSGFSFGLPGDCHRFNDLSFSSMFPSGFATWLSL